MDVYVSVLDLQYKQITASVFPPMLFFQILCA